ncbi:PREDICTED: monocarboxylate transporter 14 [Ceratosolen solmsi marchali]|uniref:Monocarboxylate transporter 14 n=1 Tax=Ceratosolen solmsi marchali TaxID=326594 RepID=A0AAJ6YNS2_9HYME|nr:PREDICTED: monocarboxylate transporter 14 [Ceratosolen solmsi marchali]
MVLKKSLKNGFKQGEDKAGLEARRVEESEDEEASSDYEASDGGWGWMVTLGLVVVFVTTIGPNASFTIVFGDFLEGTNQAGSVTTMLNSLFNISYSLAGLVTSPLLKQFSMRSVGVIGAILFSVPNVMMAFVHQVLEMAVIFFLQGIGLGLMFTICNTNFNAYFDKKRSMVMGISQAVVGLGGIVYPTGIELMMEEYGFRGTAAILGALSLHCISAMALMRPPSNWKAKFRNKKSIKDNEQLDQTKKLLVPENSQPGPREIKVLKRGEKWNSCRSLQDDDRNKNLDLTPEVRVASVTDVQSGVYRGRSKSLLVSGWSDWSRSRKNVLMTGFTSSSLTNLRVQPGTETLNNAVMQLRRAPTNTIAEVEQDSEAAMIEDINRKTPRAIGLRNRRLLDNLIDFSLLKDRPFLNMCLGISFVFTSDFTFAAFLPLMMTSRGFTKADAALAITASASAELVSRICLAIFTIFVDARPKMIFFVAMIGMTLAKLGYLYLEDTLTGTMIMVAAIGAARSWLLVPQPLVVVENVSVDQFAAAYGVYAVVSGIISVLFGPFAGLIKDWTDSFVVCQIVLLVMNALFIVPWAMEIIMTSKQTKSDA